MKICRVILEDHLILTELTKASKAYWQYSVAQLEKWSDDLTITPEYLKYATAYKLTDENRLVGYYSFFPKGNQVIYLDNLFIHPNFIRQGCGKFLMTDFLERVQLIADKIILHSDPNAEGFYKNFGFKKTRQLETSIPGRFLPMMEKK